MATEFRDCEDKIVPFGAIIGVGPIREYGNGLGEKYCMGIIGVNNARLVYDSWEQANEARNEYLHWSRSTAGGLYLAGKQKHYGNRI